jgi:nucleoside-diphosphate-sugar epimerase
VSGRRLLLTGGSGFIGRHCIPPLLARGYEVHATTSRTPLSTDGVHWHRTDLLKRGQTTTLLAKVRPDSLLHLAWYAEHGLFWQAMENLDWVRASIGLLQAFIAQGGRRAVFAGSCAEYDWTDGICRENATPLRPSSLYGASKQALGILVEATARRAGISCAWGRIFFLHGPGEHADRLVPSVVRAQLQKKPFVCASSSLQRDFLHVSDVASALAALLDSPLEGAVNIGSGEAVAIRTIVEKISRRLGHPELVQFDEPSPGAGTPPLIVADITRLRRELDWAPRIGLEESLELSIEWWRKQINADT